jgi:hypothetical protein
VTRYVFTVEDSHLLPPAGLPAHPSIPLAGMICIKLSSHGRVRELSR